MRIPIDFPLRIPVFSAVVILVSALLNNPLDAEDGGGNGASVIVAYTQEATSQDITKIEEKYGLQLLKALAAANSRVYRALPSRIQEQTLRALGSEKAVRYAEVDQEVTTKEEK